MKSYVIFALLALLFLALFAGCNPNTDRISPLIIGEHQLQKMQQDAGFSAKSSWTFISGNSSSGSQLFITFAWKINGGDYAISTFPIEKFRIRLDDKVATPTVRFNYREPFRYPECNDLDYFMKNNVNYIVLTVKPEDWQPQIHLPLNDPTSWPPEPKLE